MSGFATFADMRIRGSVRRAIVLSAASALAAGLIAGCTSDPPTTSDPTVSGTRATATPSPSASPTVNVRAKPERPDAWDDVSVDGAIAVATYFMELYGYTYATADPEPWNALSHPECVYCTDVRSGVHDMASAAQHTEGGAITLRDATATMVTADELFSVDAIASQDMVRVVTSSGVPVTDWSPPQEFKVNVLVLRDNDRWYVRGVNTADVEAPEIAAH